MSLFEVGHLIASGNFSKVYEGTHIFSDKVKVALKCVPKRRADRYLDIVSWLNLKNIWCLITCS